jgi:hypothetical protein
MNPRIRELAVQAHAKDNTLHYYNPEFIEKFAELIVRECCAIADEVERADMDSFASKFIKAHFGVEE